jgi:serine/threonine-protein kinase
MPQPGDVIDGKYVLIRVLGTGGMGIVFEAEHLRLKQRCAIKMLSPEMLRETEIIHRFEREARASALLKSPHVTRVTDVATTAAGVPYIVMELLTGHDLDGELQARRTVPYPEAVDYVLQACAAVSEAHTAGIIHRDLKPGNLFVAQEAEGVIVKVLDFGISKMVEEDAKLTSAGMTMGTALYMSPEQIRSAATVDARSDIWSLGVILYELVCGEPPFVGTSTQIAAAIVSEDAPQITQRCPIPPALGAVIHRTLRRPPAERFASVGELAAALAPFAPPESVGAAVAAQIARRGSSRNVAVDGSRSSGSLVAHGRGYARTAPLEASTSVSHEVNTSVRNGHDSSSRRLLLGALAVVLLVATLGAVAVAIVIFRRPAGGPTPTAAGSTSATTAALVPDGVTAADAGALLGTNAGGGSPASVQPPATSPVATAIDRGAGLTGGAAKPPGTGMAAGTVATSRPAKPAVSAAPAASVPAHAPATATVKPPTAPAPTAPQFL